jgi:hypothetical protein
MLIPINLEDILAAIAKEYFIQLLDIEEEEEEEDKIIKIY